MLKKILSMLIVFENIMSVLRWKKMYAFYRSSAPAGTAEETAAAAATGALTKPKSCRGYYNRIPIANTHTHTDTTNNAYTQRVINAYIVYMYI